MKLIHTAMATVRSFMNMGLFSGTQATSHFLGTASCLAKLKRPALEVAWGVMHGMHLQRWRDHVYEHKEETCDQRDRL
jgi:hypothetical protein